MNAYLTPLEVLNIYFSNGKSLGNKSDIFWHRVNSVFTWENVIRSNFQADLAPFLHHIITKALHRMPEISLSSNSIESLIPPDALSFLKNRYHANLFRNLILMDELNRVTEALSNIGIRAIPLKGGYLATNVYADIACRPMSDIDVLIQNSDKVNTYRKLLGLGYRLVHNRPSNRELHETFIREVAGQKVIFEVHNLLVKSKFRKRFDIDNIFELGYIPFGFQMLYYCWHTVRHGVTRFIWICDIAELLRQQKSDIDWNLIQRNANEYRVKQEAGFILCLAYSLLGSPQLKNCPVKPGKLRQFMAQKMFLNQKGTIFGHNNIRQRLSMSITLMKPLDIMILLTSCIGRLFIGKRKSISPIGTIQGGLQ